jgi:probable phosphoglycerate mutase
LQGNSEVPLNATGIGQAHAAKARLTDLPITTICCSPLGRARQTADIINEILNCPIVTIEELRECSFGDREGELLGDDTHESLFLNAHTWGGEPYEEFMARAVAGINKALSHSGPVLIICHGGIYHSLKEKAPLEFNEGMKNGVPVRITPPVAGNQAWAANLV